MDTSSAGWAYVVSRPHSALHLGHVAWGYTRWLAGELVYTFGSVEDSRGLPIARPEAMEFWQQSAPHAALEALVARLAGLGYRRYKSWPVADGDPAAADAAALRQSRRAYWVCGNNCLDSVHVILTAYGAGDFDLLDPRHPRSWVPNSWYGTIPVPSHPLTSLVESTRR